MLSCTNFHNKEYYIHAYIFIKIGFLLLYIALFCLPSDVLRFLLILSTPWMDIMQLLINCIQLLKTITVFLIGCFSLDGLMHYNSKFQGNSKNMPSFFLKRSAQSLNYYLIQFDSKQKLVKRLYNRYYLIFLWFTTSTVKYLL